MCVKSVQYRYITIKKKVINIYIYYKDVFIYLYFLGEYYFIYYCDLYLILSLGHHNYNNIMLNRVIILCKCVFK